MASGFGSGITPYTESLELPTSHNPETAVPAPKISVVVCPSGDFLVELFGKPVYFSGKCEENSDLCPKSVNQRKRS